MKDIDQVRLCAIAMGFEFVEIPHIKPQYVIRRKFLLGRDEPYWPITNDSQAMALMKRFMLQVDTFAGAVETPPSIGPRYVAFSDKSINHAIVECVALMQYAKQKEVILKV